MADMENNKYPQSKAYDFILQQNNSLQQPPKKSRKRLIITILIFLLLAGGLLVALTNTTDNDSQEVTSQSLTLQQFEDPRFKAQIPAAWITTSGYEPGKGEVQFIGKASGLEAETELDNREIVLSFDVISSALAAPLPEGQAATETFSKNGVNYTIASVTSEAPEAISTTALHAEKDGSTIVGTLILPQAYFELYEETIHQVLSSVSFND